jgi:hypothetical protein
MIIGASDIAIWAGVIGIILFKLINKAGLLRAAT